jgi:hypothetical protein
MTSYFCSRFLGAGTLTFALVLLAIAAPSMLGQNQPAAGANPVATTQGSQASVVPEASSSKKDESEEVRQLRERVQLLEKTVEDLKVQMLAVAAAQKGTTTNNTAAVSSGVSNTTASSDAPLAAPGAATVYTGEPAPSADPSAKKQDKSGNTFEIYGFAMLDAGYQFGQNHPDWFDVVRTTKLPSFENEFGRDGNTFFGVRQSRFGVKSSTPTKWGDLKTIFEWELFGTGVDAGQTTLRLRHAYGELGQFGAGQYWSPFMDIDTFPNTVEYWGPTGMPLFRNVQVRWMPIKGRSFVTIALERPGASGDAGVVADRIELAGIKPKFAWPDLSWEARYGRDWGYIEIAGILRSMKWVDTNDDELDLGGSDVGWGFNLTSNLKMGGSNTWKLGATYGEGIQNYMNDSPIDVGAEFDATDPARPIKGRAIPLFGMLAYLDHTWNEKFTSSFGYSFQNNTNTSAQADRAFHRGHYASGNVLYSPVKNATIGAELIWGRRENYRDGFTSDDTRIQFIFKYNFSKSFEW